MRWFLIFSFAWMVSLGYYESARASAVLRRDDDGHDCRSHRRSVGCRERRPGFFAHIDSSWREHIFAPRRCRDTNPRYPRLRRAGEAIRLSRVRAARFARVARDRQCTWDPDSGD